MCLPACITHLHARHVHAGRHRKTDCCAVGDQTNHLLWRLQNGETPDAAHQPAAAVILIGTNDLGIAMRSIEKGGMGLEDPTPCAVGAAVRYKTPHFRLQLSPICKTRLNQLQGTRLTNAGRAT